MKLTENRGHIYRHCWKVRRREIEGRHWSAQEARLRAEIAELKDRLNA